MIFPEKQRVNKQKNRIDEICFKHKQSGNVSDYEGGAVIPPTLSIFLFLIYSILTLADLDYTVFYFSKAPCAMILPQRF